MTLPSEEKIEIVPAGMPFIEQPVTRKEVEHMVQKAVTETFDIQSLRRVSSGGLQSQNYDPANTGWRIGADGLLEIGAILYNKTFYYATFEGTDGWTVVTGGSSSVAASPLSCRMSTGATSGSNVNLRIAGTAVITDFTKNPTLFAYFKMGATTNQEAFLVVGTSTGADSGFGFRINNATLQSYHSDGVTEVQNNIPSNPTITTLMFVMAKFNSNQRRIYYYLNGKLEKVHSTSIPESTVDTILRMELSNSAAENKSMDVVTYGFFQDR